MTALCDFWAVIVSVEDALEPQIIYKARTFCGSNAIRYRVGGEGGVTGAGGATVE